MNDEFRKMELAHCQEMLALIDAALVKMPPEQLLAAFERIHREDVEALAQLGVMAWRENGKSAHRQQLLERNSEELERADLNNRRLLAQHFVKVSSGRKDVRALEGEAACQAILEESYCGSPAVAEFFTGGIWRPICGSCLEGL